MASTVTTVPSRQPGPFRLPAAAAHPVRLDVPAPRLRRAAAVRDADHRHRAAGASTPPAPTAPPGTAAAVTGVAMALFAPAVRPARRPVRAAGGAAARRARCTRRRSSLLTVLALAHAPLWALFAAAVPAGATVPQVGPMVRARWARGAGGIAAAADDRRGLRVRDGRVHLRHRPGAGDRAVHRRAPGRGADRRGGADPGRRSAVRRAAAAPSPSPQRPPGCPGPHDRASRPCRCPASGCWPRRSSASARSSAACRCR